jgi:hypothetical protein
MTMVKEILQQMPAVSNLPIDYANAVPPNLSV